MFIVRAYESVLTGRKMKRWWRRKRRTKMAWDHMMANQEIGYMAFYFINFFVHSFNY